MASNSFGFDFESLQWHLYAAVTSA